MGEKRKGGRIGEEDDCGRKEEAQENMNTKGKSNQKGNQLFMKQLVFYFYNFRFIGSTGKLRVNTAWRHLFRVGWLFDRACVL